MNAYEGAAALHNSESSRVFAGWTDRYRDAHGEVARREFGAVRVSMGRGLRSRVRATTRRRRPVGPTTSRGLRLRGTLSVCGSWRGLTRPWPCALAALWFSVVRSPRRWGGSRIGGSVGLLLPLWVGDAGARALDAALRRANQMATINGPPRGIAEAHGRCLSLERPRSRPQTRSIQEKIMQVSHRYPKTSALRRNRTSRAPARL